MQSAIKTEIVFTNAGDYDVIVVGGGIAGCAAALSAARAGMRVLLLEKMTMLGGLATAGHIVIYLPLCDGYGRQVCGGIAEELIKLCVLYSYGDDIENWKANGKRYETRFNGPAFALALEELLLQEGVTVLYDSLFIGTQTEDGRCLGVLVENKSGHCYYSCESVVDASGDAEVSVRNGLHCPAAENSLAIWCYCTENDGRNILKRGGAEEHHLNLLTMGNIDKAAEKHIVILPYFGDTADNVNRFVLDGHARLRTRLQQDDALILASLPSMPQIRMARRIEGAYRMTDADAGKHFDDNIGATGDWRRPAPVYEIPYRALCTSGLHNVLTAGRCISAAGEAWEVTRVIPAAAVSGQAAGVAAAIVARTHVRCTDIPIEQLRKALQRSGALLDVNRKDVL